MGIFFFRNFFSEKKNRDFIEVENKKEGSISEFFSREKRKKRKRKRKGKEKEKEKEKKKKRKRKNKKTKIKKQKKIMSQKNKNENENENENKNKNLHIKIKYKPQNYTEIKSLAFLKSSRYLKYSHRETYYKPKDDKTLYKLRVIIEEGVLPKSEFIAYEKENETNIRHIITIDKKLEEMLQKSLQVTGVVRKTREVFFIENSRIYFDEVRGLGNFLEIESTDYETIEKIMKILKINQEDTVKCSYIDLLYEKYFKILLCEFCENEYKRKCFRCKKSICEVHLKSVKMDYESWLELCPDCFEKNLNRWSFGVVSLNLEIPDASPFLLKKE